MILEVCCGNLESALLAAKNKVERIELCSALALGGLTPSFEEVDILNKETNLELMILVRPRAGNFVYSKQEKQLVKRQINSLAKYNVKGFVIGVLDANANVDFSFLKSISNEFGEDFSFTFHRAFDFVKQPFEALDKIVDLGFERILTSGQQPNAVEGIELVFQLIEKAKNRISIMPGSGINSNNITQFLKINKLSEIHLSCKKVVGSNEIGKPFNVEEYFLDETELLKVQEIITRK